MAFWEQLKRGVSRAADEAEKQATIARLNLEIKGVKGNIREKLEDLGQVALELYRKGNIDHPDLEKLVVEIGNLESRVEEIEKQIAAVRDDADTSSP